MKILLIHNSYREAGGEDVVFQRESELIRSAGHVVSHYRRSNEEIREGSVIRQIDLARRTIWASDSSEEVRRILRTTRPDVVHAHNTFPLISPSIYSACRREGIAVVQTLHNYRLLCPGANFFRDGRPCEDCTTHGLWQGVWHGCYRGSRVGTAAVSLMLAVHRQLGTWTDLVDRFIVLTEFARKKFIQCGLPAAKLSLKPNFVEPDPGARTSDGGYAIYVGRLAREKGVHTLLSAWSQLKEPIPLHIIGDGPALAELKSFATSHVSSAVYFRGSLPANAVMSAMKQARFLVFPSELYETFGLAIIEAFACGVPVLASNLGVMQELVEDGRTGLIFRVGDPQDLAAKVTRAWENPDTMRQFGINARAEYESKYTAEQNYKILLNIYRDAISRSRRTEMRPYEVGEKEHLPAF